MTERRKHQEYRQVDVVRLVCARPQYTALPLCEVGGADRAERLAAERRRGSALETLGQCSICAHPASEVGASSRCKLQTVPGTRRNERERPIADIRRVGLPLASSTDLQRTFDAASTWLVPCQLRRFAMAGLTTAE